MVQPPACVPASLMPPKRMVGYIFIDRQGLMVIFQQHQRLAHRLARQEAVFIRADRRCQALVAVRVFEQAQLELGPQDPPDGIVEPRLGDVAFFHGRLSRR